MKYLAVQGYRCTGCGMRQDPAHARHFRFCHYTGKYFCQKCHTNASSIIPAHILHRWSFKKYIRCVCVCVSWWRFYALCVCVCVCVCV